MPFNNKHLSALLLAVVATFSHANTLDLDNLQPPVWLYQDGTVVPQHVLEKISSECGIEDAANKVANAKSGEFESAFQALLTAAECFNAHGFEREANKPL
ncbi:hypothetical protein [Enterovibrio coralii]|uniref:Uncharacterized protein n=1 Tax=Enterovibrio coralii TaxID=294935 RepID=A0A135IBI3_9GAMM|nr:hypothetical protein [Enterovibrio coralii]KXF82823.1 hypothetical protein ATN88_23395 [Enterovibrio coralii]